jgi:hypothetical protein
MHTAGAFFGLLETQAPAKVCFRWGISQEKVQFPKKVVDLIVFFGYNGLA